MYSDIDIYSFKNKIGNIEIIDIRDIEKYNSNHIPTSINIPSDMLINNIHKYLEKEKEYYIYCQHGNTSVKICKALCKIGYKAVNVKGGYEAWLLS